MNKRNKVWLLVGILLFPALNGSSSASSSMSGSSEEIVFCSGSIEAIQKALEVIGKEKLAKANKLTVGRLKKSYGNGKYIGFECNTGSYEFKLRCDYDPEKGYHYNVELGNGAHRRKIAYICKDSSENSFQDKIDGIYSIVTNIVGKDSESCSDQLVKAAIKSLIGHFNAIITASNAPVEGGLISRL